MAILADNDRQTLWQRFMSDISSRWESSSTLTKADIRSAVNDIDQWVDDNSASFNSAISLPSRTELTTKQKAEILMAVVKKRWEVT